MSFGSKPNVPPVVPPPNPATMADPSIAAAAAKTQQTQGNGIPATIATSGQGASGTASTSSKQLFGQ